MTRRLGALGLVMLLIGTTMLTVGVRPAGASSLVNPITSFSSSLAGAVGVTYTATFTTATGSDLTSVAMTVPPGTGGSPVVGTVAGIPGSGIIALASNTLTYSFAATLVGAGTAVTVRVGGMTNAPVGTYTSTITTYDVAATIDSGSGAATSLSSLSLSGVAWSPSTTISGAGASYSYNFITDPAGGTISAVTMVVPPGTAGTPVVASVSGVPAGGSIALATNTLTYSFTSTPVATSTASSIIVSGLTNTAATGAYPAQITTINSGTPVDSGSGAYVAFSAHGLSGPIWASSAAVAGATGASYTYSFTTVTGVLLTSVTMTVPPGTGGTPAVGAVVGVPAGGSVALASNTLTYSFTPTTVAGGTATSIQITGLTNTATAGTYGSEIATNTLTGPIDAGLAAALSIAPALLTGLSWAASSTATGATAVSYTFGFTTATSATLSSVTMTVPPGTSGTPAIGTVTPGAPAGGSIALVMNRLVYSFTGTAVTGGTAVSVQVTGLTNTSTVGTYASEITINQTGGPVNAGTTSAVTFAGGTLSGSGWSSSATTTGATGVSYTYALTTVSTSPIGSITMTVPSGTAGASLSVVSASGIPTGSAALAGTTVTYTVATTLLPAGTAVVLVVGGFTNSATAGTYTSTVSTKDGATTVDTGTTSSTIFTAVALTTPAWATSSTVTGAATTSYTFTFKPGTTSTLNSATMTVPQGTTGTAAKGTVTPAAVSTGGAASLTGTNLTYTFTSTGVTSGTAVSIQITGLTNTATTGSYTSTIDTFNAGVAVNSGVTAAVGFGSGVLGTPTWSASATGVSATGVSYTYTFTTATPASLSSVTMSLPTSAVKTLTVGSATGVPVGTATMTATLVTYAFTSTQVAAGTAVSLTIGGFTNTTTAGTYASTITTENGATAVDSGVSSPSLVLTTGTLTTPTWTTSSSLGASANTSYTYSFTNPTSQTLNQVTMTVPPGTSGSPVVGTVTPASVAAGGTVALAGTTITYTFTSGTVAAVAISIQLTGLTNTSISGTYPSHIYEVDALAPKASGVTPAVSIAPVPPALTVTATCGSSSTCTISAGQSQMTLIAIPGAATVTTGGFVLAVQSDSSGGYKVQTQASALTTSGGSTLLEASSSGLGSAPINQFYATGVLSGSGVSGAALCAPYGSSMPFVGYSTPVAQSIWYADAPTGTGSDTVTLTDGIQASILQPAGDYTGHVNYSVVPSYTGTATC